MKVGHHFTPYSMIVMMSSIVTFWNHWFWNDWHNMLWLMAKFGKEALKTTNVIANYARMSCLDDTVKGCSGPKRRSIWNTFQHFASSFWLPLAFLLLHHSNITNIIMEFKLTNNLKTGYNWQVFFALIVFVHPHCTCSLFMLQCHITKTLMHHFANVYFLFAELF